MQQIPSATISDRTAREVIRGLLALAGLLWIGIFALEFRFGKVEPSIIVAATGITGGLVGLVSLRHGPDTDASSSVDAPNASQVTVNTTPPPTDTGDSQP